MDKYGIVFSSSKVFRWNQFFHLMIVRMLCFLKYLTAWNSVGVKVVDVFLKKNSREVLSQHVE